MSRTQCLDPRKYVLETVIIAIFTDAYYYYRYIIDTSHGHGFIDKA